MPVKRFLRWARSIFGKKKKFRLGIYGLPNTGKTSIANRICVEWTGRKLGKVSNLPHETRAIKEIREVTFRVDGKEIIIDLIDIPGISHRKDLLESHYKTFLKHMSKKEARSRVHEAIQGVKVAVKSLDYVDAALVVMDAAQNPYNPINAVILGALESRNVPIVIVVNKTDLKKANPKLVKEVYSDYTIVNLSCLKDESIENLYKAIARHHK